MLDRGNISSRQASYVVSAICLKLNGNLSGATTSHESIRRAREQHRRESADRLRNAFPTDSIFTVHWDSKKMSCDQNSKKKDERLPVLVTWNGGEQILGVALLDNGTGLAQANAVYELLCKWNLADEIVGMCSDTTASNTGRYNGACTLLQKKMPRPLHYFACRHHMLECVVSAAFKGLFGPSMGPDIAFFQRFSSSWETINKSVLRSSMSDKEIQNLSSSEKEDLVKFIRDQMMVNHARADYHEFLELALLFLGNPTNMLIKIRPPGAVHRARWMAKIIYCLKMYIFRDQFSMSRDELGALRKFNTFVVKIYLKYWFTCELPTFAPENDLRLLKDLITYRNIDPIISENTFRIFSGHTWYLTQSLVALAFFDLRIGASIKTKMVEAFKNPENKALSWQANVVKEKICSMDLHDFVTVKTKEFLCSYQIDTSFFSKNPATWAEDQAFLQGLDIIKSLKVTNDVAERAVALAERLNGQLTNDEDQYQCLVQTVDLNRKVFPSTSRASILGGMESLSVG